MDDAICAIATPYGVGAISVIRTSGKDSISLVNRVFKGTNLTKVKTHTIHYGYIIDNNDIVDEVLVSVFKSPRSFTAENSVEISAHGGIFSTNRILEVLIKNGFRLASPGEFTKRAFLNKRLDLTQGEAVMDIIHAQNNIALLSANAGLRKRTSILIENLRNEILSLIANIEVNIDYPEYDDVLELTSKIIIPKLEQLIRKIKEVLEASEISKIVLNGIKTAIIGRPNVGKSSILNALLEEEKAIVSTHEGTTRDIIEGTLNIGNITLRLIDTAGIRHSDDEVEQIGINRAKEAIKDAELIILVLDSSVHLTKTDLELLELTNNKKRLVVANKTDLSKDDSLDFADVKISALTKEGFTEFESLLKEILQVNEFNPTDQNYLSNARHIGKMNEAYNYLNEALKASKNEELIDMIEIDIKEAYNTLGEIIGVCAPDDLINELFSKFCLGK